MKVELENVKVAIQSAKALARKEVLEANPDDLAMKAMASALTAMFTELELEILRLAIEENE